MSYNKLNFKRFKKLDEPKELIKLDNLKNLYITLFILKNIQQEVKIKFYNGRKYTKIHTLVKGPKCHKVGKHLIKYSFYTYYVIISKEINFNRSLININKYFSYILNYLNIYDTNLSSSNKYLLNTYIDIM